MQNQPEHHDKIEPTGKRLKLLLIALGVIAVIALFVVLHLTGAAPRH